MLCLVLCEENRRTVIDWGKKLRMIAEGDNVKVSGILYVFDELVCHGLLDKIEAARIMAKLVIINPRFPLSECRRRISNWLQQ